MVDCLGMDALLSWRAEFPILDTCTYLVSHSLGAMPARTETYLAQFARGVGHARSARLARRMVGDRPCHGRPARADHWRGARHDLDAPERHRRTVDRGVMPELRRRTAADRRAGSGLSSNHYLFHGFERYGAQIVTVPSDDGVRGRIDRVVDAIDERTALVNLSLVLFRSAHLQDVRPAIEKAHRVGARVVLDLYQAAGAVPVDVTALGTDFAVGGSVKWLCGGPGAGYLYVRPDLLSVLRPAVVGWAGHSEPFQFRPGPIDYAEGLERFQSGTPNVPSLYSARAGYEIVAEVGAGHS